VLETLPPVDLIEQAERAARRAFSRALGRLFRPSLATRQRRAAHRVLRLYLYEAALHDQEPLYVAHVEAARRVVGAIDAEREGR
jgi:hypothetical protein